jgi:hypothetical protein
MMGVGFTALWNSAGSEPSSEALAAVLTLAGVAAFMVWNSPRALSRLIAALRVRRHILEASERAAARARARFQRKPVRTEARQTWPRLVRKEESIQ